MHEIVALVQGMSPEEIDELLAKQQAAKAG
jgi:hypothetical protein